MSEDEQPTPEDQALLAALAALEPGRGLPFSRPSAAGQPPLPAAAAAAAAEEETLTRLHLEALGLVPFALAPVAPRPELKRRVMALAAGGEAPAAEVPQTPETRQTWQARETRPSHPSSPSRSSVPSRSARWPLALAAALILALLGTCGWLFLGLRQQEAVVARLAAQRNAALRHAGEAEGRLGRLRSQVVSMRDSLAVVTSPAAEVCNLRPSAAEMGNARGVLFVAADHQHWTMSLRGVRPAGSGKVYQVWFVTDQGMVSGGTLGGPPMELGSAHMPAGTKGVTITLEDAPGSPAPSGPEMLRNADTLHTL
ncbi:MAG: anti-sigma factor [Acidobacteria bacterium]|nr:anti-sigma factor [Acidobacteriota bacterium]